MKTYEEMQKKLIAQDEERQVQLQTLKDALDNAKKELEQLNSERLQALEAGDTAAFTQKNTEIQMKEFSVQKMQEQLDHFVYPIISAPDFHARKEELRVFTNKKLDAKYCRIKELLNAAAAVLDEVKEINQQHGDTYSLLERLTYGNTAEVPETDLNGVRYYRSSSATMHLIPAALKRCLEERDSSSAAYVLTNMIELKQYI